MRFSLSQLLVSVTSIAFGIGLASISLSGKVHDWLLLLLFWSGTSFIGAGIGSLYKRPLLGGIVGSVSALTLAGIIVYILFNFYFE